MKYDFTTLLNRKGHDALALDVHQKIGCTKVNAYIYTVKKHTFTYF